MKKSVVTIAAALAVGLGTIFSGVSVTEAKSISSLKGEQNDIHSKRANVQSDINQANNKINTLKSEQADVQSEMKRLDFAINDTTTKIADKSVEVKETKAEVTKLQAE